MKNKLIKQVALWQRYPYYTPRFQGTNRKVPVNSKAFIIFAFSFNKRVGRGMEQFGSSSGS